jgi:DNA-binding Xre family transcriptional regulator
VNFLEKLDKLLEERSISKYTLSKESGIPLSTILSFYDPNKGYENIKLNTLKTLVNYFGCSYEYLVEDGDVKPDIQDKEDKRIFAYLYANASPRIRKIVDLALEEEESKPS